MQKPILRKQEQKRITSKPVLRSNDDDLIPHKYRLDEVQTLWEQKKDIVLLQNTPDNKPMTVDDLKREHTHCQCCGTELTDGYDEGQDNFKTVEHILPKARFPQLMFDYTNLTIYCRKCNEEKGMDIKHSYENPFA